MKKFLVKLFVLLVILLGFPLAGVFLLEESILKYLEFPPRTIYIFPAPFSWTAFIGYSAFIIPVTVWLIFPLFKSQKNKKEPKSTIHEFPWWGWAGLALGLISWGFAWTRFSWFSALQPHTFLPLWLSYILVVNGLNQKKTGHSMISKKPIFFLLLFPTSAIFWWFFEFLNRFVQNWHYHGVEFSPWEYFWYATFSFSTVLPAVLGTRDLIINSHWIQNGYKEFLTLNWSGHSRLLAFVTLMGSALGLFLIGAFPDYLFALLWISPLLILFSLQVIMKEPHIFKGIALGDWRIVISSAFAALICGWFWEMWNFYSLSKWTYAVPFVHRFEIFEMPILGFAGYLPFGLECAVIGTILERFVSSRTTHR